MSKSLTETAMTIMQENTPATNYNDLNEKYSDGVPGPKTRAKIKKNVKNIWRSRGFKKSVASNLDRSSKEDTNKIRETQKIASTVDPERKAGINYVGKGRSAYLDSGEDQLKSLHGTINRVAARRAKKQKIANRLRRDISEGAREDSNKLYRKATQSGEYSPRLHKWSNIDRDRYVKGAVLPGGKNRRRAKIYKDRDKIDREDQIQEGRKGATGPRQRGDQFGVGQSAPNDYIENNTFFKALARRLARAMQKRRKMKMPTKTALGRMIGEEELIEILEEACILGWINENIDKYCDEYGETRGQQELAEDVWTSHGNQLIDITEAGLALPKGKWARQALLKKYDKRSVEAGKTGTNGKGSLTKGRRLIDDMEVKYGVLDRQLKKLKNAKRMGDHAAIAIHKQIISKKLKQAKSRRRMYGKLTSNPDWENFNEEQEINEIAVMNTGAMTHMLRSKRNSNTSSRRSAPKSAEQKEKEAKEKAEFKVRQAFDKLKPQAAQPARKIQQTYRTGLFGRKLKPKDSDFRTIPAKKARPDLQFEEIDLSEE